MKNKIAKAFEMTDARISFVSLVNKAANKKQFLITKSEDGNANFESCGRILKADAEAHYVTGIVYEPMKEDTDGNYMTEEEITKAAHWFAKNGNQVDLQHNFEPLEGAVVVESSVTKCDQEIEGQTIAKGTWLMTVEITDPQIFEAIEKGDITGFSMGGVGKYSEEDVLIEEIQKVGTSDKKGFWSTLAKAVTEAIGLQTVEKGEVEELYKRRVKNANFWDAFYSLQDVLYSYNYEKGEYEYASESSKIQDALSDFNDIVTKLLTDQEALFKSMKENPITKAGSLSDENHKCIESIHKNLGTILAQKEEEEVEVTKSELEQVVSEAIEKAMKPNNQDPVAAPVQKEEGAGTPVQALTEESVSEMIEKSVKQHIGEVAKALGLEEVPEVPETEPTMDEKIQKAVQDAISPFMQQAGVPTNLNGEVIEKAEEETHYLAGIL